jgi:hypothetical protein
LPAEAQPSCGAVAAAAAAAAADDDDLLKVVWCWQLQTLLQKQHPVLHLTAEAPAPQLLLLLLLF